MLKTGSRFSLRDKLLFKISEVEITRVDCISYFSIKTSVVVFKQRCIAEALLMILVSTTCFHGEIRKICGYPLLSGAMLLENEQFIVLNKTPFQPKST